MNIRPFDPDRDYPGFVDLAEAVEPDDATTIDEVRSRDERRPERCRFVRHVAEADGIVVGSASAGNSVWSFDPGRFYIGVQVAPTWRQRGIGGALYGSILDAITPYEPHTLTAGTREDRASAMRFLAIRRFAETMRERESRLAVESFDPARWADALDRPAAAGVRLTDFATLLTESGDTAYEKLYTAEMACDADVPQPEGQVFTAQPYDEWRDSLVKSPGFRPEAFQIAVAPDESVVGVSMLFHPQKGSHLGTGLTGVVRDWRRHGIATALKVRALTYAASVGAAEVRTENAQSNRGMLAINDALGFVAQPYWINFARPFE